ncbi:hypothetical protein JTE90_017127 [Oedothorax gibbosus]|uniref:Uncharacterized protein n=1 Tax=Oedothorax gibbosus TaxID=931172 RepID=A0AAV6UFY3_9ARAC|nr:hypothetical protein JTE90_017127 [Oedothorax gibbosus]
MEPNLGDVPPSKKIQEYDLQELAKKELLRDIKCAAARAEQFGAHSWAKKTQKYVPSKRFLHHMIVNDSRFNDRKEHKSSEKSERDRHRQNSSYAKTDTEKSSRRYSSNAKNRRTTSSESDNRYEDTKSEKSVNDAKKYHSKKRKHKNDRHSPHESKHHKSKKHQKHSD